MNIYEVRCNGWWVRVKAGTAQEGIARGLGVIANEIGINDAGTNTFSVTVRVLARDVSRDAVIPAWEGIAGRAGGDDRAMSLSSEPHSAVSAGNVG